MRLAACLVVLGCPGFTPDTWLAGVDCSDSECRVLLKVKTAPGVAQLAASFVNALSPAGEYLFFAKADSPTGPCDFSLGCTEAFAEIAAEVAENIQLADIDPTDLDPSELVGFIYEFCGLNQE